MNTEKLIETYQKEIALITEYRRLAAERAARLLADDSRFVSSTLGINLSRVAVEIGEFDAELKTAKRMLTALESNIEFSK